MEKKWRDISSPFTWTCPLQKLHREHKAMYRFRKILGMIPHPNFNFWSDRKWLSILEAILLMCTFNFNPIEFSSSLPLPDVFILWWPHLLPRLWFFTGNLKAVYSSGPTRFNTEKLFLNCTCKCKREMHRLLLTGHCWKWCTGVNKPLMRSNIPVQDRNWNPTYVRLGKSSWKNMR